MQLLGRGRTAEVFLAQDGRALKLFFADFPAKVIRREADKARVVTSLCSFAPAFYGETHIDGRAGLLYERIDGAPLIDCWSETDTSSKRASSRYSKFGCPARSTELHSS